MFSIANRYVLAEETTLDTREQKKELGHPDQPSSSKGLDKKRKLDHSINAVERTHRHKEYWPKMGKFEGFLDHICIFYPQGEHKTRVYDQFQGLARGSQGQLPQAYKEVNYIFGGPESYEPKMKQKLTAREALAVGPTTPSTLDGPRSPLPSTAVPTQTLYQSRGGILW
jgi:hypothetical protein